MAEDPHIVRGGTFTRTYYTVTTLPTAASSTGEYQYVTDLNQLAGGNNGQVAVGGGFNRSRVRSDGTNWRIASFGDKRS